jgi:glycosyltransferase involved in cell wall biosynthesis
MNRNVLFFLPGVQSKPSGGYKVVYEYANYLSKDPGLAVSVIHSRALIAVAEPKQVKLLRLRSFKSAMTGYLQMRPGRPISWFDCDPGVGISFTAWIPKKRMIGPGDLVIATAAQTAPFVAKLAEETGARAIYFLQSYETWDMPKEFVDSTWRLPFHRVSVSYWLQRIGENLGVEVSVVPNAVSSNDFPKGVSLKKRERHVLALVSSAPKKRTDLVLDVYRRIQSWDPNVRLSTFGTCPRPSDFPEGVVHLQNPMRSDLAHAYREAQVYLCASDIEGWGLPAAEALLSGTALVSTMNGGVNSFAGDYGTFVECGDANGIFSGVTEILDDPDSAQGRTDRGCRELLLYSPEKAAERFRHEIFGGYR